MTLIQNELKQFEINVGQLKKNDSLHEEKIISLRSADNLISFLNEELASITGSSGIYRPEPSLANKAMKWRGQVEQLLQSSSIISSPGKAVEFSSSDLPLLLERATDRALIVKQDRSVYMLDVAESSEKSGVWKIGDEHVNDLRDRVLNKTTLTTEEEFDNEFEKWLGKVALAKEVEDEIGNLPNWSTTAEQFSSEEDPF